MPLTGKANPNSLMSIFSITITLHQSLHGPRVCLYSPLNLYSRASQTLLSTPEADLEKSRRYSMSIGASTNHRRIRVICLIISLFCFLAAVPCVVVEALAAFHVQFCDGEDLMMLYVSDILGLCHTLYSEHS